MSKEVRIAVRPLVEYAYRNGSIDWRISPQTSLQEGTRAHKKIQETYQESDQKEVYLQTKIMYEDIKFMIDGRCDGLLFRNGEVIIDEIKSFSQPLNLIKDDGYEVHWAQAKMYAYMYAKDQGLEVVSVRLTYVQVKTEEMRVMQHIYSFSELETFATEVLRNYAPFANLKFNHQMEKTKTIKELRFPFPSYRRGQRKLAGAVYKTIESGNSVFVEAPTGIGKTISTMFPAIKAIGEGHINRFFYLTAKTITRTTAEEAFERMKSCGLCLKSLTITAKEKICFKEETNCQKDYCEFADGYYDRVNTAILDILATEHQMTREVIEAYARKHRVCPFELSVDLAYQADAVICDYNYIFDPKVSLKRLLEDQKKSSALLVDEAHNLLDRGREMFSSTLNKETFLQLKKEYKGISKTVYEAAGKVNAAFIAMKKEYPDKLEFTMNKLNEGFLNSLDEFAAAAEESLRAENRMGKILMESYLQVLQFGKILDMLDGHYVIYAEKVKNNLSLKLFCIDPSYLLQRMGKGFRAKVFFSATFSPMSFYMEMLGAQDGDTSLSLPSPFSKEQVDVFIQPLSTRFKDRDNTIGPMVAMIRDLVSHRPGNYLIFFPSYKYMLAVYESFKEAEKNIPYMIQEMGMTEQERERFLEAFKPGRTLIGFAVLGGIFSEGIDLMGDRLNGVIVAGVGLPQICFERDLIKDYFIQLGKDGFEYAYIYPGMNKVLQAGGRLIRSEKDRGTIVLVDDRFLQKRYQLLLPQEWSDYTVI